MRVDRRSVYLYRALFGVGFLVLGAMTVYRVAVAPGPLTSKTLGLLTALVFLALGGVRIGQYVRARRNLP